MGNTNAKANDTNRTVRKDSIELLPCEFCNKLFSVENIALHQSSCRPDLLHYGGRNVVKASESGAYGKASTTEVVDQYSSLKNSAKSNPDDSQKEPQHVNSRSSVRQSTQNNLSTIQDIDGYKEGEGRAISNCDYVESANMKKAGKSWQCIETNVTIEGANEVPVITIPPTGASAFSHNISRNVLSNSSPANETSKLSSMQDAFVKTVSDKSETKILAGKGKVNYKVQCGSCSKHFDNCDIVEHESCVKPFHGITNITAESSTVNGSLSTSAYHKVSRIDFTEVSSINGYLASVQCDHSDSQAVSRYASSESIDSSKPNILPSDNLCEASMTEVDDRIKLPRSLSTGSFSVPDDHVPISSVNYHSKGFKVNAAEHLKQDVSQETLSDNSETEGRLASKGVERHCKVLCIYCFKLFSACDIVNHESKCVNDPHDVTSVTESAKTSKCFNASEQDRVPSVNMKEVSSNSDCPDLQCDNSDSQAKSEKVCHELIDSGKLDLCGVPKCKVDGSIKLPHSLESDVSNGLERTSSDEYLSIPSDSDVQSEDFKVNDTAKLSSRQDMSKTLDSELKTKSLATSSGIDSYRKVLCRFCFKFFKDCDILEHESSCVGSFCSTSIVNKSLKTSECFDTSECNKTSFTEVDKLPSTASDFPNPSDDSCSGDVSSKDSDKSVVSKPDTFPACDVPKTEVCEFCSDVFDSSEISEHRSICKQQLLSSSELILKAKPKIGSEYEDSAEEHAEMKKQVVIQAVPYELKVSEKLEPKSVNVKSGIHAADFLIPCEFCSRLFYSNFISEHQSGCRPDLLHFKVVDKCNLDLCNNSSTNVDGEKQIKINAKTLSIGDCMNSTNNQSFSENKIVEKVDCETESNKMLLKVQPAVMNLQNSGKDFRETSSESHSDLLNSTSVQGSGIDSEETSEGTIVHQYGVSIGVQCSGTDLEETSSKQYKEPVCNTSIGLQCSERDLKEAFESIEVQCENATTVSNKSKAKKNRRPCLKTRRSAQYSLCIHSGRCRRRKLSPTVPTQGQHSEEDLTSFESNACIHSVSKGVQCNESD